MAQFNSMDTGVQEIDIATGAALFNWTTFDHIDLNESCMALVLSRTCF
jgi:hypothetical protein